MKKLLTLAVLAATSSSAFASDNITGVAHSNQNAAYVEVHFNLPTSTTGDCKVEFSKAPNTHTPLTAVRSTVTPLYPGNDRHWAEFHIPHEHRAAAKQLKILCPHEQGTAQHVVNLVAPPSMKFTVDAVASETGGYDISGGVFIEGYAAGTRCHAIEVSGIVDHKLFEAQLGNQIGYHSTHIPLSAHVSGLYHGYGHAKFECSGKGGNTLEMLEFYDDRKGGLTFEQTSLNWY